MIDGTRAGLTTQLAVNHFQGLVRKPVYTLFTIILGQTTLIFIRESILICPSASVAFGDVSRSRQLLASGTILPCHTSYITGNPVAQEFIRKKKRGYLLHIT